MMRNQNLVPTLLLACLVTLSAPVYGQGGRPADAGKPADPGKPDNVGKPTDPGKPDGAGKPDNAGKPNDPGTASSNKATSITWLTKAADIQTALEAGGTIDVQFKSGIDVENVFVWLTPSLSNIKATPESFAKLEKDKTYSITLKLEDKPDHTLGGTLQLRVSADSGRTYSQPLPIVVKVKGDTTEQDDAKPTAVTSSADYEGQAVAPGQTVSVFGTGLGPNTAVRGEQDSTGRVSTTAGGSQVLFNGVAAPLLAASATQINAVVPQSVAGDSTVDVVVTNRGKVSAKITVPVVSAAPAVFSADGSGRGQGAVLNQDGTLNASATPAKRGSVVALFGSGFGEWTEPLPDGTIIGSVLPTLKAPVSVTIGGVAAKVLYAGGAPGLVSGVVQINAEVPTTVTPGEKVTVVVSVGGSSSSSSVTIAVQ